MKNPSIRREWLFLGRSKVQKGQEYAISKTATITIDGKSYEFPIIVGTEGEQAIDITDLRAKTGLITFDPSYGNTGCCTSSITFIDGEKGILRYRGIPIEELAEKSTFIETAQLLIFGKMPTEEQIHRFSERLTRNAPLHEGFKHHFEAFPVDAPPMAMLSAMINSLSCFHQQFIRIEDEDMFEEIAARLISKVRTIAAYSYRMSCGMPYISPDPKMKYVPNFLHMMFSQPYDQYFASPEVDRALNLILLLHADHEQNCSTSTVRAVGSSKANLFASIAAGVNALWGPLHGGANVAVLEMLEQIQSGRIKPQDYVRLAKDKGSGIRLMGFGHRIYRNFDPRAKILKNAAEKVLAQLKVSDPLLEIAQELEAMAQSDPYFIERKLYPNVDFYSGIIMKAIGLPVNMFTVMFAMGRMPGWIAQWKEQHDDPTTRIARPRQIYVGPTKQTLS